MLVAIQGKTPRIFCFRTEFVWNNGHSHNVRCTRQAIVGCSRTRSTGSSLPLDTFSQEFRGTHTSAPTIGRRETRRESTAVGTSTGSTS